MLLAAPTFIEMLPLSGSSFAPALSASALTVLARVCSLLSFLLMLVRGMYGKWLYRRSAASRIRRIQSEFPDARQRQAVLRAQGGVSFGAVFLCLLLLTRRQPLYPAARPRPAGPAQRFLRLIAPSRKTIIVKEFES